MKVPHALNGVGRCNHGKRKEERETLGDMVSWIHRQNPELEKKNQEHRNNFEDGAEIKSGG